MEKTSKPIIEKVHAREILDSRGFPTVEVEISAAGHTGISAVPSGASTGEFEALELRDGDKRRFNGKGVLNAVNNVINEFGPSLIGHDASNQSKIDELLIEIDGSSNKSTFGPCVIYFDFKDLETFLISFWSIKCLPYDIIF